MNNYKAVREIIKELDIDGILISNGKNIRYISGFTGETGYLYISKERHALITDFRYTYQAEKEAKGYEVITIDSRGYEEAINDILGEDNVKNLGFESMDMLYDKFIELEEKLNIEELVPVGDDISRLRRIKTPKELEYIKHAQAIGDKVFSQILTFIKPGMTELEVAARIEYLLKTNGAEGLSFDAIVASGINSSMPHAEPSHKIIEKGDFLTMDYGCVYNGYCSDMTRTIVIGKASKKQKDIYNTVLKAQLAALEHIRPGIAGKDVDKVARDIINNAGYEGSFGHGLGHSLGLFIHENPRLSPSEDDLLEVGMVETVEPGIYIRGFGGVRIEDLVVIREGGYENFTFSDKDLIEL